MGLRLDRGSGGGSCETMEKMGDAYPFDRRQGDGDRVIGEVGRSKNQPPVTHS